jgi:hypothetical protein
VVTATLETVFWIGALAAAGDEVDLDGLLGELAEQMVRTWRPVANGGTRSAPDSACA